MNREIKFRAWDSVHNRMIYSDKHLGFRPFEDNNSFDNYDFNISKKGVYCFAYDEYDDDFGGGVCNETDLPIMEYVGLKDKNGVEIYENMILDNKYIVLFENCKYILKDISNGDIIDLWRYMNENRGEITKEYSKI